MIRSMIRRATGDRWPVVRSDERLSCPEVGRLLQRFLDDELPDDAAVAGIARHLDDCDRCGLEAETYQKIKDALAARRPDLSPETVERLREFGVGLIEDG
jgi:anti-sigma factor RsiW